ncbi:hypothetical protein [Streptomyces canus]|uniref:hypothetical protein n=1 Tax=Streptomyces canus TaxID=58343 RepID=UPI0036E9DAA9
MGRFIGLDIHRDFAQVAAVKDGLVKDWGRVDCRPQALREFAAGLRPDDQVALEATRPSLRRVHMLHAADAAGQRGSRSGCRPWTASSVGRRTGRSPPRCG